MEELPKKVDVVVLGTGLPESILAAACSRSGLSVLHLDRNKYYGGAWSSFNLKTVHEWIESVEGPLAESPESSVELGEGESVTKLGDQKMFRDISHSWHNASEEKTLVRKRGGEEEEMSHREHLENDWRRFSLDLTPKVVLACGEMVRILVDSDVAKYAEFKCVDRFLCMQKEEEGLKYYQVPCSKSEIFSSTDLGPMEKRRLMTFFTFCLRWKAADEGEVVAQGGVYEEFRDKPFEEFLASKHFGITGKLKYFVTDAIGILHPNANTSEGLAAVCRFIDSVGKFGNSPFLTPLYGCGELPQCFCRLCAVFGGTYCLDRPIEALIMKEGKAVAVVVAGQRIDCDHVVMSPEYLPADYKGEEGEWLTRSLHVTNQSIVVDSEKERISLVNLCQLDPQAAPRLFEAGFEACSAPKGYYVLQFTGKATSSKNPLDTEKTVFSQNPGEGVRPLWSLRFSALSSFKTRDLPENVAVVPGADASLDYSSVVEAARAIFKSFWSDTDFLPPSLKQSAAEQEERVADQEAAAEAV